MSTTSVLNIVDNLLSQNRIRANILDVMAQSISKMVAIWDNALKTIKSQMNDRQAFDTFFGGTYVDKITNQEMVIVASTNLACSILKENFMKVIRKALDGQIPESTEITFVCKSDEPKSKQASQPQTRSFFADSKVNRKYTFDNFINGPSNKEAYQAALFVASNPGAFYNPLLIYGGSGLGKTHLLHAIGNQIREKNPLANVLYVTTQDFFDEYVRYVRGEQEGESLKAFFKRSVDVLLVDDIQFLVGKRGTEEMFFSVFQALYTAGKQIVITCDQLPSKLQGLDERLRTRFEQGLPVSVGKPTKETCEAIVKNKIIDAGLDISSLDPEVLSYFSTRFNSNVRELEGAVNRLVFYVQNIENKNYIDLKTAIDSVRSLVDGKSDEKTASIQKVIDVVAEYYKIPNELLISKSRTAQIALARHVAMYLCRTLLESPYKKIGEAFGGRDHATVINGIKNVETMLKEDGSLQGVLDELSAKIKPTDN